jgi:two-component system chemotaxis response regulator CheY
VPASDARQALTVLGGLPEPPGLIMLDLMLPDLHGRTLANTIRADDRFAEVPIVVVSASDDIVDEASAIGAVAALRKPYHVDRLIEIVRASFKDPRLAMVC